MLSSIMIMVGINSKIWIFVLCIAGCLAACNAGRSSESNNDPTDPRVANYYVVNFDFSKDEIHPLRSTFVEEKMKYSMVRSTEMFLAIYEKGSLSWFYDFPNPLLMRGGANGEKEMNSGNGSLLFPGWIIDKKRASQADIGIYKVKAYIEDFKQKVQRRSNIKALNPNQLTLQYLLYYNDLISVLDESKLK